MGHSWRWAYQASVRLRVCAPRWASEMGRIRPKGTWHPHPEKDQELSQAAFNEDTVLWFNTPVSQSLGSNYHVH